MGSASLLEREGLLRWITEWSSCKAWMQDFVNAIIRPVNSSSWPQGAGLPTSVRFHVAFRGHYVLPPDTLSRSSPTSGPCVDVPQRLFVGRVRLARNRRISDNNIAAGWQPGSSASSHSGTSGVGASKSVDGTVGCAAPPIFRGASQGGLNTSPRAPRAQMFYCVWKLARQRTSEKVRRGWKRD